jgi:hypothetical protein
VMLAPKEIGTLRMLISPDPSIQRDVDRALKTKESQQSEAERLEKLKQQQLKTDMTTIKAEG